MIRRAVLINAAALLALTACEREPSAKADIGAASERSSLRVAVTAAEHAALLDIARPLLERQGIALTFQEVNEAEANARLARRDVDVVCFENRAVMDAFNTAQNAQLVAVAGIDIRPRGIFSRTYTTWDNVPGGSTVAVPDDAIGRGRALLQLQRIGVIELESTETPTPNLANIALNPLRLEFRLVPAAGLTAQLDAADFVIMDVAVAQAAGMDPVNDALNIEDGLSRFANFLVARADNAQDARVTALANALTSEEVAAFLERSGGQMRAAFR